MEKSVEEIFNDIVNISNPQPNSYSLGFELDSLKELFEFLLQLVTLCCKYFYGDEQGRVNLDSLSPADFKIIDTYIQTIGFTCIFQVIPANSSNLNWAYATRYDRIHITLNTKLEDLHLGLKCNNTLYIIKFKKL